MFAVWWEVHITTWRLWLVNFPSILPLGYGVVIGHISNQMI